MQRVEKLSAFEPVRCQPARLLQAPGPRHGSGSREGKGAGGARATQIIGRAGLGGAERAGPGGVGPDSTLLIGLGVAVAGPLQFGCLCSG